jgi:DNA invertase Pin-like site-specific DNA recombinase
VSAAARRLSAVAPPAHGVVALYLRISDDPSGRAEGVRAQERRGRAYAAKTWPGYEIVVFPDNDRNSTDDNRPQYKKLREWIAAGRVAHLWTIEQSRLERLEGRWFALAAELEAAGITEVHTHRDGIIRHGDLIAGIKAVFNAHELRVIKARVRDRRADAAARGVPPGGRPYGYRTARKDNGDLTYVIVPEEAAVIREAADKVLAGWSANSIAADLTARGLHGPHRMKVKDEHGEIVTEDGRPVEDGGTPITVPSAIDQTTVRHWLTKPVRAGVMRKSGLPGNWEPILDMDTWTRLRDRLGEARTVVRSDGGVYEVSSEPRSAARRYLLTGGIAVCGVCGSAMTATLKKILRGPKGRRTLWRHTPYYRCDPRLGGACVGIMGDQFEDHVVALLFKELEDHEFVAALSVDDHREQRAALLHDLGEVKKRRVRNAELHNALEISDEEWEGTKRGAAAKEAELDTALAALPDAPIEGGHQDPEELAKDWPHLTLDEKRYELSKYLVRVTVAPATPGMQRFDEKRIRVDWRTR